MKTIYVLIGLLLMAGIGIADEIEQNDYIYFTCNNATDGVLMGSAAHLDCYNSAATKTVNTSANNIATGQFTFQFTNTTDRYGCFINCPIGAVDYTIPVLVTTTPLVATDNIGINLDDTAGTLDAAEIGTGAITSAKIAQNAIGTNEVGFLLDSIGFNGADISSILTDTNELQSNQTKFVTATGYSTHSAADVWTAGSRALSTPSDYKADVTNLDMKVSEVNASTYSYFTSGSNENVFKATGFSSLQNSTDILSAIGIFDYYDQSIADMLNYNISEGNVETDLDGAGGTTPQAVWEYGYRTVTAGNITNVTGAVTLDELVTGMWNESQSVYTTASTFGNYLDAKVSAAQGMTDEQNATLYNAYADTNELQLNQTAFVTAVGFSTHSAADVDTEVTTNHPGNWSGIATVSGLTTEQNATLYNTYADTNEIQLNQSKLVTAVGFETETSASTRYDALQANASDVVNAGDDRWLTATGFASLTNATRIVELIDALNDITTASIWEYGNRNLTYVDNVWSVAAKVITGGVLTTPADYKADVSTLATTSQMNANTSKILSDTNAILADTNELQGNQSAFMTATGFSTHSAADVDTELTTNHPGNWSDTGVASGLTNEQNATLFDLRDDIGVNGEWDQSLADMVAYNISDGNVETDLDSAGGTTPSAVWAFANRNLSYVSNIAVEVGQSINSSHGTGYYNSTSSVSDCQSEGSASSRYENLSGNMTNIRSDIVIVQADLDTPSQYKADVSTLATLTNATRIVDMIDALNDITVANIWQYVTRTITGGNLTTPNDYKADVSSLATSAELYQNTTAIIEHGDLYWNSSSVSDCMTQDNYTDLKTHGDSGWIAATGFSTLGNATTIVEDLTAIQVDLDTPNQYKADISTLATTAQMNANVSKILSDTNTILEDTNEIQLNQSAFVTGTATLDKQNDILNTVFALNNISISGIWEHASRLLTSFNHPVNLTITAIDDIDTRINASHETGDYSATGSSDALSSEQNATLYNIYLMTGVIDKYDQSISDMIAYNVSDGNVRDNVTATASADTDAIAAAVMQYNVSGLQFNDTTYRMYEALILTGFSASASSSGMHQYPSNYYDILYNAYRYCDLYATSLGSPLMTEVAQ